MRFARRSLTGARGGVAYRGQAKLSETDGGGDDQEANPKLERVKAQVRARAEHPFHVLKNIFRHRKTPYRGLAKPPPSFTASSPLPATTRKPSEPNPDWFDQSPAWKAPKVPLDDGHILVLKYT
jgi:hypothetical protein